MSFSSNVKAELMDVCGNARHCQLAELSAIVHFAGKKDNCANGFVIPVENEYASSKCFTLLEKTFNINSFSDSVVKALNHPSLLRSDCCRRAYLRGAFLSSGSLSDPNKGYHLEFVCVDNEQATKLIDILAGYDIEAHQIKRKKYIVVYLKEGEAIVDVLNIMGAYTSLMNLENTRILKEISNSINRRVNCETANIAKTVSAASKQTEDIIYIKENYGLRRLPDRLREMAEIRLEYPEATLKELGELLDPPVGKSGVNHRLRKISEFADSLRGD